MCKLKSSHLYAIFSLWINNPLKALLYFSVHNDIQHYQIQWVLERLLITRNILGFAIKSIKRDNFHAPLAALGHTYKWWIYVWTGFFSFHTTQPTIQDISALDAVEEFLHLFVNTNEIVLILWSVIKYLSPVLGVVLEEFIFQTWRFEYQEHEIYFVTEALCYVTDKMPQGRGKWWGGGVYLTQCVFVSREEKDAQAWRRRLICQHNFFVIICCCPDWPQLPNDRSLSMPVIHPEAMKWVSMACSLVYLSQRAAWSCYSVRFT